MESTPTGRAESRLPLRENPGVRDDEHPRAVRQAFIEQRALTVGRGKGDLVRQLAALLEVGPKLGLPLARLDRLDPRPADGKAADARNVVQRAFHLDAVMPGERR